MRATGKSIWLEGFRQAWKQLTVARGEAKGNSLPFPGQTESLEPDGFSVGRGISHYLFYYIIICLLPIKLPS